MVGLHYHGLGSVMALPALALSIEAPHQPHSLYVATGTLALVWLADAAMAFRAARNRRFLIHRDRMIRSYVLTWTLVGCRIATNVDISRTRNGECHCCNLGELDHAVRYLRDSRSSGGPAVRREPYELSSTTCFHPLRTFVKRVSLSEGGMHHGDYGIVVSEARQTPSA
jgi:hypothetical protein